MFSPIALIILFFSTLKEHLVLPSVSLHSRISFAGMYIYPIRHGGVEVPAYCVAEDSSEIDEKRFIHPGVSRRFDI